MVCRPQHLAAVVNLDENQRMKQMRAVNGGTIGQ